MGLAWSNKLSMPVEGASTSPRLPFKVHSFSTYCIISGTFDIFFDSDVLEHIILTPANDTCITVRNSLSNALPETNVAYQAFSVLGVLLLLFLKWVSCSASSQKLGSGSCYDTSRQEVFRFYESSSAPLFGFCIDYLAIVLGHYQLI